MKVANFVSRSRSEAVGSPTITAEPLRFTPSMTPTSRSTALWGEDPEQDNRLLFEGPADWVSPQVSDAEVIAKLPAANGRKVSLLDSDHWFISAILKDPAFGRGWVWKAFRQV